MGGLRFWFGAWAFAALPLASCSVLDPSLLPQEGEDAGVADAGPGADAGTDAGPVDDGLRKPPPR